MRAAGSALSAPEPPCPTPPPRPTSPARAVSGHLRLLAHIGGILNHDGYVRLLLEAEGRNELVDLVRDAERMIFGEDPGPSGPPPDDQGDPVLA